MTPQVLQSRLTAEGRATVPAAARKALGVNAGDRLVFIVEGDQVRIASATQLIEQVWANNHGGDAGDSVADVRALRETDVKVEADSLERIDVDVRATADQDPEEVTARLLTAMGFSR